MGVAIRCPEVTKMDPSVASQTKESDLQSLRRVAKRGGQAKAPSVAKRPFSTASVSSYPNHSLIMVA
jgi:hypothetical protein